MPSLQEDIDAIARMPVVATILDVVCRTTGMGFAAVARVTEDRWIACSVLDKINFGLLPGGELKVETTICQEVRHSREPVIIEHVARDADYCSHPTPRLYGFQSYISMPIVLPDGRFFGTLCSIDPQPARLKTPEIVGMFRLFADLIAFHFDTEEKLARSETNLLREREISELREQFIGVLGHDLRNPLGAISMGTTLLQESPLSDDQSRTVSMMSRSVARMSDLIDDALDFTRGRLGGGISIEARSDLPLEPVLRQVVEEVRARWPKRELQVQFDLREPVTFDRRRMAQLFTNLLSNAMTHGRAERPVTAHASSGQGRFELSVANAADPIPPENLKRIFEPFSRGQTGDYQQGLGLGLYISAEIARSHAGTLSVSSTPQETRFTLTMPSGTPIVNGSPMAEPAGDDISAALKMPPPGHGGGARILLIEDHDDTLETLTRLLTRQGHEVTPVTNGSEARQAFSAGDFDLIISDLGLPDCSGLDLVAGLLADRPTPAVAMSGYGMETDLASSKAAGFSAHLTKPIDLAHFLATVNQIARKPA